ncbi:type I 3-dehydroquinate dehydratase [Ruminococcaceae bacterium OttesenSCG-928-L11]|nr:type I 3-dehydroquinate dehydratase [Ruminococcaceae bacterium OttesenSCG-928-L11]
MKPSPIVHLRQLAIGDGAPKVCAPLTAADEPALLREADTALAAGCDLVEWRADCFVGADTPAVALPVLQALRERLGETPLLFTLRTQAEGGNSALSPGAYAALCIAVAQSSFADAVDVEFSAGEAAVAETLAAAHSCGVPVVLSSHNFAATPSPDELAQKLAAMYAAGGDIVKLATMPQRFEDVLALMAATCAFHRQALCPVITMSMGEMGRISRISGGLTGSAVTFGVTGSASAPGQLAIDTLRQLLAALEV